MEQLRATSRGYFLKYSNALFSVPMARKLARESLPSWPRAQKGHIILLVTSLFSFAYHT